MKLANATPVYKKGSQLRKGNHCLLAFYLMHLKFLNDPYMSKFLNVLKTFCQNVSAISRKGRAHNTVY